ncbi:MAG: ABC transporter ATP-binding protein [Propionibacteriaceae bacterium]|jgi:ABC-type multidrug transport system ATPase subunit|nr:ABC transporter ATP-binding protein [Propionibacteriaceae bacterium]
MNGPVVDSASSLPTGPPGPERDQNPDPAGNGIAAIGLRRSFGEVLAVAEVTFTAPVGAITALVGPNGSGKTTLLLILAGLLRPDSGRATLAGYDVVTDNAAVRGSVGWMPDVFGTWDALTCREILTIFGQAYGMGKQEVRSRAQELLERLYLTEFADRPARVLSRGQKQRLGLARALIHDPAVLLLDEPASGLDPRSRVELRNTLRELANAGKTVLVSSHVLSELEEVYDHAVFLSKGRTVDTALTADQPNRSWKVAALDPTALRAFLTQAGIPHTTGNDWGGEISVNLAGDAAAAELLRAAVAAGVPVHTIAPMAGQLETTYLSLNEERV